MKSYLEMAASILVVILSKLWMLLKSICTAMLKNRKLCKILLMIPLFALTWTVGAQYGQRKMAIPEAEPEVTVIRETPEPDPALEEMLADYKQTKTLREVNACLMAKVLYGYRDNSEKDLEGICWVILNRVDNQSEFRNFNTLSDVINCPSQWMGYNENNPVIDSLYDIAESVLTSYETDGRRMFGQEYLYFEWSSEYLVFKSELYDSRTCKTWRNY